jgi:hypothetical protein
MSEQWEKVVERRSLDDEAKLMACGANTAKHKETDLSG